MPVERRRLIVKGVVQGVGFRPFVWRLATELGLGGSVSNRGDAGVEILVEGEPLSIATFVKDLRGRLPPLARVDSIEAFSAEPLGERSFSIAPSHDGGDGAGLIPPDVAVCEPCVADLLAGTRYHHYWATSCTNCGPRFTVIKALPYDRPRTSMEDFPMCPDCEREYTDPLDRRYHAQTTACPVCGPRLRFDGDLEDPIGRAAAALRAGKIVAIKGIGGTHLACDATNEEAVKALRGRRGRPAQPFALMAATRSMVEQFAAATDEEWRLLESPRRPIVVLRKRPGALSEEVAPGLHTVGVMLPYTGLHHLLFRRFEGPLVMTSANLPGRPMLVEDEAIRKGLVEIADHFLLHDRRIVARCDDSVLRRSGGTAKFLRRSRGYVPEPLPIDLGDVPILALGPETDLTFALYAGGAATLSQHVGSVDNLETFAFLAEAIDHLTRLLRTPAPRVIACDLHPTFLTTRHAEDLAARLGARLVRVQHHEAHAAAVMAEHGLDELVAIVLDGFGYGRDGNAWGGEVFLARRGRIERAGSLASVALPGGDLAARRPLRMVASFLHAAGLEQERIERLLQQRGMRAEEVAVLLGQIAAGKNAPQTTSAGRFLDAVSALLGLSAVRTYEGEPAMRLEALATGGTPLAAPVALEEDAGRLVLNTVALFAFLYDRRSAERPQDLAATAQDALARGTAALATEVARREGVRAIGLSGGVAYNDAISSRIQRDVENAGFSFFTNERVPCGDGGVAFGQLAVAATSVRSSPEEVEADVRERAPDRSE